MNEHRKIEAATAPRSCAACQQPMRLSYREAAQSGDELRVYECHGCRTTTTIVCPGRDEGEKFRTISGIG